MSTVCLWIVSTELVGTLTQLSRSKVRGSLATRTMSAPRSRRSILNSAAPSGVEEVVEGFEGVLERVQFVPEEKKRDAGVSVGEET